jgi:hypothetical protein
MRSEVPVDWTVLYKYQTASGAASTATQHSQSANFTYVCLCLSMFSTTER